jgi:hypothetical protein
MSNKSYGMLAFGMLLIAALAVTLGATIYRIGESHRKQDMEILKACNYKVDRGNYGNIRGCAN